MAFLFLWEVCVDEIIVEEILIQKCKSVNERFLRIVEHKIFSCDICVMISLLRVFHRYLVKIVRQK